MRFWIKDQDSTPQGLPLKLLIKTIINQLDVTQSKFWIHRSEGYGLQINEWDRILDEKKRVSVDIEHLLMISEGREEWFYNLDVEITSKTLKLRFGLHDSSALYLEGPQDLCKKISQIFTKVEILNS